MAEFSFVPVVDVEDWNMTEVWPTLTLALNTATFVAIDLELSGLGERKKLNARDIDDRYKEMCNTARTRSVLSLGLSCFKRLPPPSQSQPSSQTASQSQPPSESTSQSQTSSETTSESQASIGATKEMDSSVDQSEDRTNTSNSIGQSGGSAQKIQHYQVQTFNILLLCRENFTVEPLSLRFLVEHGFDFNRQYAHGISYSRGADKLEFDAPADPIRRLVSELVRHKRPIVLHNGIIDLVFLYGNFYAELPPTMAMLLADLAELFPAGVYDTKYICEFQARFSASFLAYVFKKCQRDNMSSLEVGGRSAHLQFVKYPEHCTYITQLPWSLKRDLTDDKSVCQHYAAHGWCSQGKKCENSHDLDLVLDSEHVVAVKKKRRRERKRKHKGSQETSNHENSETQKDSNVQKDSVNDADTVTMETDSIANDGDQHTEDRIQNGGKDTSCGEISCDQEAKDMENMGIDSSPASSTDTNNQDCDNNKSETYKTVGHRAGYDSFMTGFIFTYFCSKFSSRASQLLDETGDAYLQELGMGECVNRLSLTGKDVPLQVMKSSFAKTSKGHREKIARIRPV